ncbi:MAG: TetR/AcrR family transcriptional regulator [Pseudomonadota bacterium]
MTRKRLSRQNWIDTGLDTLASAGPGALAAEPLARKLNTTKGSFYWHFKDVPAFHEALIKDWQGRAFASVVAALSEDGNAEHRLRRFGDLMRSDEQDSAFRAWARADASVAHAVAQVDAERLTYLENLLKQLGLSNPEFAQSCLGALIGLPQIGGKTSPDRAFETMVDLVVALK